MAQNISSLTGFYSGKSGLITGSGPSLLKVTESLAKTFDVILTINFSILRIRKFHFKGDLFCMWKDAGHKDVHYKPICVKCDESCFKIGPMKPEKYIVHEPESCICHSDFSPRYIFNNEQFGYQWNFPSIMPACRIMELFGLKDITIAGCDSVFGNYEKCDNGEFVTSVQPDFEKYNYGGALRQGLTDAGYIKTAKFLMMDGELKCL